MRKPQTSRSTIGKDPFDLVVPKQSEIENQNDVATEPKSIPRNQVVKRTVTNADRREATLGVKSTDEMRKKKKLTVHLSAELAERVKNAAYWNPKLTIAAIAEQGIKSAIEKYERENGGAYPEREGALLGGRPIK